MKGRDAIENSTDFVSGAVSMANSAASIGGTSGTAKQVLGVVGSVGDAIKPFVPLIATVTIVITECIKIYEDAQYNKKICNSLMDRVETADWAIRTLKRRKQENESKFRDSEYYKAFLRFVDVMKKIRSFIKDVSQIQGFKKYVKATAIKDKFHHLIKEFEAVMGDLSFTMAIANDEQRRLDQESLNEDIAQMNKFLKEIQGGIIEQNDTINTVLQEVIIMKNKVDQLKDQRRPDLPISETLKATTIEPKDIMDPLVGKKTDCRGKKEPFIYKKSYKAMEVACIPRAIPEDDSPQANKIQAQLAILGKLRDSPNILKFYGLSHLDNQMVMVVEWAELGSLREVYNTYDIAWPSKVQIALDICRGITFLHTCSILHHDIRCANIMMTLRLEPKITGFEYARLTTSATTSMTELTDVVHWLAPEKLRLAKDQPYNTKCEIFSFGMLLWELAFEKIPYENWNMERIKEWVLSGKRERLVFGRDKPEIEELQQEYKQIIVAAWQDDSQIRASLQFLFMELNKLAQKYYDPRSNSPALKPDKTIDLDGTLYKNDPVSVSDQGGEDLPEFEDDFSLDSIPEIPTLDDGISAHKKKETTKAWDIFCEHTNLGSTKAKYWKGYYLWEGYAGQKDRKQASTLFKEAADDGLADAQLRYAFSLVGNQGSKFDRKVFIEYLTKAAENQNSTAQFNLGDLYLNGKLGVPQNVELGKKYLRLAALTNQPKAIEILQKLGMNIYNDNKVPVPNEKNQNN
ncbi:unnamed protein product [Rhizophagus irregularis]|uniref:Kinase-like protein n=1 Tax=Rhizophagus irregularis TaxID=588596 RepID=A0A2N1NCU2_9GLOM|nr:kinase-like protein [Rhizophagus irregularis]CAB4398666.1 unnamed protein product [Rhizophagus irregularis]CAB5386446.1 unnamed protein product [Rhizophagus irregularis]